MLYDVYTTWYVPTILVIIGSLGFGRNFEQRGSLREIGKILAWALFIKSGQESGQVLARYLAGYAGEEEKKFWFRLWPEFGQGNQDSFRPDEQGVLIPLILASALYPA